MKAEGGNEGRWLMSEGRCLPQEQIDGMTDQKLAI